MLKTVISAWLHQPPSHCYSSSTTSMLSNREISSIHLRCCQRELQRVLEALWMPPPPPTRLTWGGAVGAAGGGHPDVSQYTFRSICLGNRADKKSVRLFLKRCERRCDDVLNDSDRAGLGSDWVWPFLYTADVTICCQFDSGGGFFFLIWQEHNNTASSLITCKILRLLKMLFIWSEMNKRTKSFIFTFFSRSNFNIFWTLP